MSDHDLEMRFVFTEMPSAGTDCVFVEVEDSTGASISAGEWRQRDDGLVELVVLPKLITISGLRDDLDFQSAAGYTAVDMTTAAAQGFRDGVVSVVVDLPKPVPSILKLVLSLAVRVLLVLGMAIFVLAWMTK